MVNEEQLREVREARLKTQSPQSLVVLAIKTVAKHYTRFIDIPDSPLQYLRKYYELTIHTLFLSKHG
jgi:hypothetical protein